MKGSWRGGSHDANGTECVTPVCHLPGTWLPLTPGKNRLVLRPPFLQHDLVIYITKVRASSYDLCVSFF